MLAEIIRQLVPHGGIFRVELLGVFVLHLGAFLVADVVEETAVGEEAARTVGMAAEKGVIALLHDVQPRADFQVQLGEAIRVRARHVVGVDPDVDLVNGGVVANHQVAQFALRRVVRVHDGQRDAGLLLHEVADGQRLVGGQQRAQKSDGQITHAFKVSILKGKDRITGMDRDFGEPFSRKNLTATTRNTRTQN